MHSHDSTEALLRILTAPRRNRFFYGKRMDVQHFQMEQDYGKHKQWLLNRLTQGKGVLCGLAVSLDGNRLCVDPGVALDGLGREIIVPVRACIDPTVPVSACCSAHPEARDPAGRDPARGEAVNGIFTLWLCYHECLADYQPVLASDCDTRDRCAAGTVVESFCLKVTPGVPPLQGDPNWCAKLWPATPVPAPAPHAVFEPGHLAGPIGGDGAQSPALPSQAEVEAARNSRRHTLCTLFDCDCDAEGDPCVPLAVVAVRDGRVAHLESCLVRPRVYSNAVLLELILCLAARLDECCGEHPPAPQPPAPQPPAPEPPPEPAPQPPAPEPPPAPRRLLQVREVEFLVRRRASENSVARVESPLQELVLPIDAQTNAIRIRFTKPFAQDGRIPSTPGPNDADFKRHNVLILPLEILNGIEYVPGSLVIESADTVRFDLFPEPPYGRGTRGWQKGPYRLVLRGNDNLPAGRPALMDLDGLALDGEPIAPAAGVLSGNGAPGGDFELSFTFR